MTAFFMLSLEGSRGSTADNVASKEYILNATEKVLNDTFSRRKTMASINFIFEDNNYTNIDYHLNHSTNPMVSILIPTKDRVNLLKNVFFHFLKRLNIKT